jgi:Cof subfamily protein (haloacid dehalogenase superfamily)
MPVRLIAMDMDGTLLDGRPYRIPEENVKALRMASERGIHLALCSGRVPDDAMFFAVDAGLDMTVLGENGGCRLDHPLGEIRDSHMLAPDLACRLLEALEATGFLCGVFRENELAVSQLEKDHSRADIMWGANVLRKGSRGSITYGKNATRSLAERGCNKIVVVDEDDGGELPKILPTLQPLMDQLSLSSSWRNNLEFNPKGADKGAAVTALAKDLQIPMSDVMTIGDNDNDVSMLRCAGWSVAMGNANTNAMAAAKFVTLKNTEYGVAEAIRALALGEEREGVRRR